MHTAKIGYREDEGTWIGLFQRFPDYWTQGRKVEDRGSHLGDLFQDRTSGELPGIRMVADIAVV